MIKKTYLIIILVATFTVTLVTASVVYSQPSSTVTKHPPLTCTATPCNKTQTDIPFEGTTDHIYDINGNLTISGNLSATSTKSGVVFVEGSLNITENYTYGRGSTGTVFVVKGNVIIASSVTQIDAVIISSGKIFTAGNNCSLALNIASNTTNLQLVINGSLISLDQNNKIEFCRTLSDNSLPAEKIIQQPKYLVILRDLMSDTYQKWSEIP